MENSSKKNKISDIVSLQRVLKKWKRLACTTSAAAASAPPSPSAGKKSIKFIKRTFSFNDATAAASSNNNVPKGRVAVSVGKEGKRYAVPMEYLGHQAFRALLREAEEEFGFQQEGVLRIPCEVAAFEGILKAVRDRTASSDHGHLFSDDDEEEEQHHQFGFPASPVCGSGGFCSPSSSSPDSDQYGYHYRQQQQHPQICR